MDPGTLRPRSTVPSLLQNSSQVPKLRDLTFTERQDEEAYVQFQQCNSRLLADDPLNLIAKSPPTSFPFRRDFRPTAPSHWLQVENSLLPGLSKITQLPSFTR